MRQSREIPIGDSKLIIETGHLAKQAHGSCTVRLGDTVVLATACMESKAGLERDFLPLTVDYREYTAAAGRIPGGFFKREGRPTEKEIITSRLIDRPLRPLFPEGYFTESQIIAFCLSADGENDPDILAINGASTALVLSEIPFYHPVGAVRVGLIHGEVILNPVNSQRDVSDLDLVVVGTEEAVAMVEAGANQVSEEVLLDCIFRAHAEIQKIIKAQHDLYRQSGKQKPVWTVPEAYPDAFYRQVRADLHDPLKAALFRKGKFERKEAAAKVTKPYLEALGSNSAPGSNSSLGSLGSLGSNSAIGETPPQSQATPATLAAAETPEAIAKRRSQVKKILERLEEEILREVVLEEHTRFDDRRLDEIRPITVEVGLLPRTHGSALFTRGETQALVTATLGTSRDAQVIEEYEGESVQKFLLHYNFPPFSVGEVKFLRGPGRREIGHGVLARRALLPVLPHEDDFPYTLRVVSDILESNGSSSMATVCGGSLALFDAGVPMLAPVAGVAMGLIKGDTSFAVLSDIAGQEDHFGDMDFKVAGTRSGVTALQMDIKITGVTRDVMEQALAQARAGRLHILDVMERSIPAPRVEMSRYAPRLYTLLISKEKIRDVIGPGGKTIRSIIEETGCQIEIADDGKVVIASPDEPAARRAIQMIERLTEVPEVGKVYTGTVRRVEPYGAFVEIMPGTDGLVHISELAPYRVREVSDLVKEGDEMTVKVINIDEGGKVRLSRKAVIMEAPDYDPAQYEGMGEPVPVGGGGERERDRDFGGRGGRGGREGGGGGRGGFRGGRGGRGPGSR